MKSKNLKIGAITMLFCVGMVTVSNAQKKPKERPSFEQLVEKLDTNKDGKLAESEVKGPIKERFSKIDTNEDGYITEEEFKNAPKPERKKSR